MKRRVQKMLMIGSVLCVGTSLVAGNMDVILEIARDNRVKQIIKKENVILDYTEKYILETGDNSPTKAEITTYYTLDSTFWDNSRGGVMDITSNFIATGEHSVTLTNSFPTYSSSSVKLQNTYKDLTVRTGMFKIVGNDINLMFSPTTSRFMNNKKIATATGKIYARSTVPTDTSMLWYKPDGFGYFEVYFHRSSDWHFIGKHGKEDNSVTFPNTVTKSNISTVPCALGMLGYLEDTGKMLEYKCSDGDSWMEVIGSIGATGVSGA